MNRAALSLLGLAAGACSVASGPANAAAVAASVVALAAAQSGVDDPRRFVGQTYAAYARTPNSPPADQSFAYSARLRALFDAYDAWARQHDDLVGSLDFDWWTNSQDWGEIRLNELREEQEGADRRTIHVRFRNYDAETAIRFNFVREHGRWFLDDAVQGSGGGDDGWTLSALLVERPE